jgi:TPP-dependent pyruvate/acetoin dehydrogenase alpha subunit
MTVRDQPGGTPVGDLAASVGLMDADLVEMYRTVALARALDERMWILNRAGKIPFVISGQGHEGAQVGLAWPLRRATTGWSRTTAPWRPDHVRDEPARDHARAVRQGVDPSSGGRQMPGHYGIVRAQHPVGLVARGDADPARDRHRLGGQAARTDQVAITIMGEGSSNQGDFHEALNFAAIHQLPVIYVVENNGYAISVPMSLQSAVEDVAVRAAGYNMPGVVVDGIDVLACYAAGKEAIGAGARGEGPTLIEAKVTRLTAHSSDDQQSKYRTEEDLAGKARDPLPLFRDQLREAGVLDEAIEEELSPSRARSSRTRPTGRRRARPGSGDGQRHVYAESPPASMDDPPGSPPQASGDASVGRTPRRWGGLPWPSDLHRGDPRHAREEMRRDESIIVLGEDVGKKGGVFLATDGLWAEFGDKRVLDTPLTESMIVGASIGAPLNGLRPVAEIQFADFIFPAFNQILSEAARMRYRSNGTVPGPDGDPRAVRRRGPRRALPLAVERDLLHPRGAQGGHPGHAGRRQGAAAAAIRDPDPVLFFEHKKMYRSSAAEVPDGEYTCADRQGIGGRARGRHRRSSATG